MHFVQGVAWDPLESWLVSQGSDRCVFIYQYGVKSNTFQLKLKMKHSKLEKNRMYHDETLLSFFRRPSFSPDGALLATPTGLYLENEETKHCVYLYSRGSLCKLVFIPD